MSERIILASGSRIRARLLKDAGVAFSATVARVDEDALKAAALAQGMSPRDLADLLADAKARKVAGKNPGQLVIGCDQILEFDGTILSKPATKPDARQQLSQLSGRSHVLYSAVVLYEGNRPVWRTIGKTRLTMRNLSHDYIQDYVERNWDEIRHSVGAYQIEKEGIRLFSAIDGDYFNILGLPLLELLDYLVETGELPG